MEPYSKGANYAPTDTAYLNGELWVTDGYASKFVMSYALDEQKWTGTIFGGRTNKAEPGKFGTNHGITIHKATRMMFRSTVPTRARSHFLTAEESEASTSFRRDATSRTNVPA